MAFRWQFIILLVLLFTLTEFECHKNSSKRIGNRNRNRTHVSPRPTMPTMDFGVSAVVDNASNVFRKIITKMLANKKLVGFDSGWYW